MVVRHQISDKIDVAIIDAPIESLNYPFVVAMHCRIVIGVQLVRIFNVELPSTPLPMKISPSPQEREGE